MYPASILCSACRIQQIEQAARHIRVISWAEHIVLKGWDAELGEFIRAITWRHNHCVRLLLPYANFEASLPTAPKTQHSATAMVKRPPDEKGGEDVHQYVGDAARQRRHKFLPLRSVHATQIMSGVLEGRMFAHSMPSDESLAHSAWRCLKYRQQSQTFFSAKPMDFPEELNKIMDTSTTTLPYSVTAFLESYFAFQWLLYFWKESVPRNLKSGDAWWSRLAPKHTVYTQGQGWFIVLFAGNLGILALEVDLVTHCTKWNQYYR